MMLGAGEEWILQCFWVRCCPLIEQEVDFPHLFFPFFKDMFQTLGPGRRPQWTESHRPEEEWHSGVVQREALGGGQATGLLSGSGMGNPGHHTEFGLPV